jgi:hypothetical protein
MPLVLDMDRARAVIKSANKGYGVVSAALPGAQKARIKQLTTPARKVAEEKKIPIKADVAGPLAKAKEISVKLKKAPPKKEEKREEKAAADLGYAAGFCSTVMPPSTVFAKVAAATRLPVTLLKMAYFVKAAGPIGKPGRSFSPLLMMLGGAAVPWLAAPAMRSISDSVSGYGSRPGILRRGPREHEFGGLDPRTESDLMAIAYRRMAVNAQRAGIARMFADAQRAGYAPSASPYAMVPGGGM